MKAVSSVFGGLLLVLAVLGSSAVYIVDEREQALLFQLGEVVGVKTSRVFTSRYLSLRTFVFSILVS